MPGRTDPRDRILHLLKTKGPQTPAELARRIGVTPIAVRQQLQILEADRLIEGRERRRGVGRPARVWHVTEAATDRFPDSHGELAVGVLEAVRAAVGSRGMGRILKERTRRQLVEYRKHISRRTPLRTRVAALARLRRDEGYMAEWSRDGRHGFLLVENHCPICAAAKVCQGLCDAELELFRAALGRDAVVERTEWALDGSRRCVYRIRAAGTAA